MTHLNNARRLRPIVERAMQSVEGNDALTAKSLYPAFASLAGQTVQQGFKFTYGDRLWRVIQPELTLQSRYLPGPGTESLYEEICETHDGTLADPIPYGGNMALEQGKHYVQGGIVYLCIRDTEVPVYHALADLVGQYVEEAKA